jgi:hypothetical protein
LIGGSLVGGSLIDGSLIQAAASICPCVGPADDVSGVRPDTADQSHQHGQQRFPALRSQARLHRKTSAPQRRDLSDLPGLISRASGIRVSPELDRAHRRALPRFPRDLHRHRRFAIEGEGQRARRFPGGPVLSQHRAQLDRLVGCRRDRPGPRRNRDRRHTGALVGDCRPQGPIVAKVAGQRRLS